MSRNFFLSLVLTLLSFLVLSQPTKVAYRFDEIPSVKFYSVKGELEELESELLFTSLDQGFLKSFSIPSESIHSIYVNRGPLKNRLFIETDSATFTFFTYKAAHLIDMLSFNNVVSDKHVWEAALMKRTWPYIMPVFNDFHWEGVLSISDDTLCFTPVEDQLSPINLRIDQIVKVRVKSYWLFFPRNILKVKTDNEKYMWVLHNPKKIKELISGK